VLQLQQDQSLVLWRSMYQPSDYLKTC
jgi:hypothetical protein